MTEINIKLLTDTAKIPTQGSTEAAGRDLYADLSTEKFTIEPHQTVLVPTGIAMAMPEGWVGLIFPRSGIAAKKGLCLANGVGVIDSDYRGEWKILLHNSTNTPQSIEQGERIAQVVFLSYTDVKFIPVESLDDTMRGVGGFGSTGTK